MHESLFFLFHGIILKRMEKFQTKARKLKKKINNKDTLDQTIGCTNIHNDILKSNNRFDSRKNDK